MTEQQRDYGFGQFFQLKSAGDLLEKLRHDYERMRSDPLNAYPAFDFFVTANHIWDWLRPDASPVHSADDAINRVCRHLANGAKHLILNKKHVSVSAVDHEEPAFQSGAFQEDAFQCGGLFVELESAEAAELMLSPRVRAENLAALVLRFWERQLGSTTPP